MPADTRPPVVGRLEDGGGRRIRTSEGISQQIYSLPPLTTWVSHRGGSWSWREELNPRPTDYKSVALPLSYASVTAPHSGPRTWPKRRVNCKSRHVACQDKAAMYAPSGRATGAFGGFWSCHARERARQVGADGRERLGAVAADDCIERVRQALSRRRVRHSDPPTARAG